MQAHDDNESLASGLEVEVLHACHNNITTNMMDVTLD